MRLYVTGGTGLVGSNIIKVAQERYGDEVIASLYGPPPVGNVRYILDPLDMRDADAIYASIRKFKPDAVIHSAALLDQAMLATQRALAWEIMVGSTRAFAYACREIGARFVFVSSDWVFDGKQPTDEDSPPFPVNFYGIMKMASERELSMIDGLNYGVGRQAGVYGLNYALPNMTRWVQGVGFGDLPNYVVDRLSKQQVAAIWTTEYVNDTAHPTLASDGADMLLRLARHNGTGIFHCFGSEYINRIELAHKTADVFGFDHSLIAALPTDPIAVNECRSLGIGVPFRLQASTDKTARALGRCALNVVEGLEAFKREWENSKTN
jgi:dTDP-4-dehydrorhamnose reductase